MEGLSSTVTSAGALWLGPSSRRSYAADDFVMDDEVVLAECDQSFVLHPSELPGQGRPVDVQIVGQLLTVERDVELRAARLYGDGVQVGEESGADSAPSDCVGSLSGETSVPARRPLSHNRLSD